MYILSFVIFVIFIFYSGLSLSIYYSIFPNNEKESIVWMLLIFLFAIPISVFLLGSKIGNFLSAK